MIDQKWDKSLLAKELVDLLQIYREIHNILSAIYCENELAAEKQYNNNMFSI